MSERIEPLTICNEPVDCVELLEDCTSLLNDTESLRQQMRTNGYIYLPGYLGRDRVVEARKVFIDKLLKNDALDTAHDPMDGVVKSGNAPGFGGGRLEKLFDDWHVIHNLLYTGPMMAFFRQLLGGDVRHFDYTWTRQVNPGPATPVHSDVVYMGRGTHQLYTAWTPLGDNGFDVGGLILLEGSNNHQGLARSYWKSDVDAYCENKPEAHAWGKSWGTGGYLRGRPDQLRRSLDARRWLTADYKMGDLLVFNIYTVHGGTDNRSNKVRLSTDSRYQRADQPADERWIGEQPPAHGKNSRRGMIC